MELENDKLTLVGHVVEVTGADFVAQLIGEDEGFRPELVIGNDRIKVGQVGTYMRVTHHGYNVLTLVESMWLERGSAGETVRMVRMNPVGEINQQGDFYRGVAHYPTTGSELHVVTAGALSGLFTGYSDADFKVGKLSSFESIDAFIDASSFFGRHVAILGQSGSGKSWTVTSLVQSALRVMPNAHIVLLDLHGEYGLKKSDLRSHSAFPKELTRCIDADELEMPYWLLTFSDLVELLIDHDDQDAPVQIAYLRSTVLELKREANADMDLGHITVDTPVYFSLEELVKRFKVANEATSSFGKDKTALFGKFDQLLVKLQSRMNDTRYDFLLKPSKRTSSSTLADLLKDFVGLGEPRAKVTVLDLSAVPYDIHSTVTSQIGRLAFEFNYWNPRCKEFPIFLICEEAHSYITRGTSTEHEQTRRAMERIAKTGRKYGVGICVVSQRPHELSETVLAQCNSFVCLRISNPDDQDYVRELVPDAAKGMLDSLSTLAQGEAIIVGEAVPMPIRVQIYMPNPPPNSSDIDYAGQWNNGPEEISVNDLVNRWRKQER